MRTLTSVGIGLAAYVVVVAGLARLAVWLRDGFGQADLASFDLWTALSSPVMASALLLFLLQSDRGTARGRWSFAAGAGCGVVAAFGVTVAIAAFLGPWFGAFSFPVFLYWSVGGAAGFLAAIGAQAKARGALLAGLIPAITVGVFLAYERSNRPLDDLLVYFEPDASRQQVEHVWTNVLGSTQWDGVVRRGVASYNGRFAIRVAFAGSATRETRFKVRQLVQVAPAVVEVADSTPYPRRGLREGSLPSRIGYDSIVRPEVPAAPKR